MAHEDRAAVVSGPIVPLQSCAEVKRFGWKAANLSHASALVNVPVGVVLESAAVELGRQATDVFGSVAESVCASITTDFVAVRSSSVTEDTPESSNAGRYRTEFVVRTPQRILAASARVAASMRGAAGAIIYQAVADAVVSGTLVAFTNGLPAPVVVEAAPGLCTTVTSGAAVDTFLLDNAGRLLREAISFKSWMSTFDGDGIVKRRIDRVRGVISSLTRSQLDLVLEMQAALTAGGFGDFLDLEWSFSRDNSLHLLQVRSATT